jgi:hypothetical protein
LSDNLDARAAAIVRLTSPDLSSDLAFPIAGGGLSLAGVLKTAGDDETPPRGRSVDRFRSSLSACRWRFDKATEDAEPGWENVTKEPVDLSELVRGS